MSKRHLHAVAVSAAATFTLGSAAFAQSQFEEDFNNTDKPWQEVAVQLPRPPVSDNLLPFYVGPTVTQEFAIDPASITVGSDGVVRYTLVAKSRAGAATVSYEGIRCATFEKKLYAFARDDGSWARSRRDQWETISRNAVNRQHAALALDYFCEGNMVAGKVQEMVERIRWKRPLSPYENK